MPIRLDGNRLRSLMKFVCLILYETISFASNRSDIVLFRLAIFFQIQAKLEKNLS